MLNGVKIKFLKTHSNLRQESDKISIKPSVLVDVLAAGDDLLKKISQLTLNIAYQGSIQAFYLYQHQAIQWFIASGKALVVLYDLRSSSPTYRQTQVIAAGKDNYKLIFIPAGVAHGYKVLSLEDVLLFCQFIQADNDNIQSNLKQLAYDDTQINFNWAKYN